MIYNGIAADGDIFPNGYTNLYFTYESDYKHGSRKNLRDAYRAAIARYGFNVLVIQTEASEKNLPAPVTPSPKRKKAKLIPKTKNKVFTKTRLFL